MSRRSLKDVAAAYVREQVLTGSLAPRTRVDPNDISERLGMSRIPVREALIELSHEGLIDTIPRRGVYVAPLTPDDIADHYRVFAVIAGMAAGRAACRLAQPELVDLRRTHERFMDATASDDHAQLNFAFHRTINRAGGSRQTISVLRLLSRGLPVRYFDFVPNWAEHAASDHERILVALEQHEALDAQRLVEHHVTESGKIAIEILHDMGYWNPARESNGVR